jgi:hypothetical protein
MRPASSSRTARVSAATRSSSRIENWTIFLVGVTVEKSQYLDLEKEAKRLMRVSRSYGCDGTTFAAECAAAVAIPAGRFPNT